MEYQTDILPFAEAQEFVNKWAAKGYHVHTFSTYFADRGGFAGPTPYVTVVMERSLPDICTEE